MNYHTVINNNTKYYINNIYHRHRFSVAPMLHWTDRHCRYFHRLLTKKTLLYTEMMTTSEILYNEHNSLRYHETEHPIVLQIAGSNSVDLIKCAKLAEIHGYDEINLNIGCPSQRVQHGLFGACLMKHALLVVNNIQNICNTVSIPVTIKTRIGIDENDNYEFLYNFISTISTNSKCTIFVIHARKAILSGLNPKENRKLPLLNYQRVYKIKKDFPNLTIVINGGIKSINEIKYHLKYVDGVMMGREAYNNPNILTKIDHELYNVSYIQKNHIEIIESLYPYIEYELYHGTHLNHITRHLLGMFKGMKGAKKWRRYLTENSYKPGANITVIKHALNLIQ